MELDLRTLALPNMNIRETLQRQTRRILRFGIVSWLAFVTSLFLAEPLGVRALPVVFFLPFLGAALAQSFFIRCPRCNGNVGLLVSRTLAPGRFRAHVANCPFCSTSFDGKMTFRQRKVQGTRLG